jgi:putative ABC transport system substrate-binding protein
VRRREFLISLGGIASASFAARAQQSPPVIGFLNSGAREAFLDRLGGFHRGLGEAGFVEGQNVAVEYRWANGQLASLPALAADLVRRQVKVIVATGNTPSALAAKAATATVPVLFIVGSDPIKAGLVASLNRPGGNATGVSSANNQLGAKRLQILRDLVPGTTRVALLVNPANPATEEEATVLREIAAGAGFQTIVVRASVRGEIEPAFASLAREGATALIVPADPFLNNERDHIIALAARDRVPAIYHERVYTTVGGLLAYGPSLIEGYRQVGAYAGAILKGAHPADLPVMQPTKYELVINLKTARALGVAILPTLLALADDVIE